MVAWRLLLSPLKSPIQPDQDENLVRQKGLLLNIQIGGESSNAPSSQRKPAASKFHGPYEIQSKISDLNYVVKTPATESQLSSIMSTC